MTTDLTTPEGVMEHYLHGLAPFPNSTARALKADLERHGFVITLGSLLSTDTPGWQESPHSAAESDERAESGQEPPETGNGHTEGDCDSVHNVDQSPYRAAWRLLNEQFQPDDDTYKGVAKDIHNAIIDMGWRPPSPLPPRSNFVNELVAAQITRRDAKPLPPPPPTKTTAEVLGELREQLTIAQSVALQAACESRNTMEYKLLNGRAKGLGLALDYLREYE